MITLRIENKKGELLAGAEGKAETALVYHGVYEPGDRIIVDPQMTEDTGRFLFLTLDDTIGEELVFVKKKMVYEIPFGEAALSFSPKAFAGDRHFHDGQWQTGPRHFLSARYARPYESDGYRNLARNKYDQAEAQSYPHASSNIETRGEVVFAARCAIDGLWTNRSHGEWPYTSWGLDIKEPAPYWKVEFGRMVTIDRIRLHIRADFPHDNWWTSIDLNFSDKSRETLYLRKTSAAQEFMLDPKKTDYILIDRLHCCEGDLSPFPALMQLEAFGQG